VVHPRALHERSNPSIHKPETVYHPIRIPISINSRFIERAKRYRSRNAYINDLIQRDLAGSTGVTHCGECMHLQFFEALADQIAKALPDPSAQAHFDF